LWTSDPDQLEAKLKKIFRRTQKHERPVDVREARDHGFLPYQNKAIKLPHLLRETRTNLPELLLVLDRTEPLDLLVMIKLRFRAQKGAIVINSVVKPTHKSKK
jgi:hypothetical protein